VPAGNLPESYDGEDPIEILTLAGMALYQAQLLEVALINLAVGLYASKKSDIVRGDLSRMFDAQESNTFSKIFKEVKKHVGLPPDEEQEMQKLIGMRNRLAPRFFREHDVNFTDLEGRRIMAAELHAMSDQFFNAHHAVEALYSSLWEALGLTEDVLSRMIELMKSEKRKQRGFAPT
jgi:uncharacterized protein YutE (UPF0331/DUF86 family)